MSSPTLSFWESQIGKPTLASLVSEALCTRTYLSGHAYGPSDRLLAPLLASSAHLPHLARWLATCASHQAESSSAPPSSLAARVAALEHLARTVQTSLPTASAEVARVEAALQPLPGSALVAVPSDYYALRLSERARLLQAPTCALCKTLVFENPAGTVVGDTAAPLAAQRYLAVILQYTAKISLPLLCKAVGASSLALAKEGAALTGFAHNGVTPLGSLTPLPIVLAKEAYLCGSPYIWLGGGREDVKARVFLKPLTEQVRGLSILPVSEPRPEEEWEA